ncbi:dimethyladenosine transferase 2, mitochondrial [Hetaerina americana]|uniref:dimethyladenosine transferase 2, mitochondrial n=1 Tax=Hetaerina americana TaxID=62018 RepID=UPI003A7F31F9
MNELIKKSDRLFLHKYDFFSIWKRILLDYFDEKIILNKMRCVNPKPWNDGPPLKIFVPSPNKIFIHHLIAALAFQKGFIRLGRLEIYLAMRPYDYHRFTCDGSAGYKLYHASSVLFQILFEKQFLCMLPRKDFIPWGKELSAEKNTSYSKLINVDPDFMYLVKITPRKDLHEIVQGAENLKALWHFVRQCFSVRSNQVIPTLEKWIPGCGPRLIFNNLSIVTEFGELSPPEVLKLFQMFSQWPEYDHCPFLDSMDTYFLRSYIDHNPEEMHEEEFGNIDDEDSVADADLDGISGSAEKIEGI